MQTKQIGQEARGQALGREVQHQVGASGPGIEPIGGQADAELIGREGTARVQGVSRS